MIKQEIKKVHQDESGSAILMLLALITVLAIIICQNGVVLSLLKKELQLVEKKHDQRVQKLQEKQK